MQAVVGVPFTTTLVDQPGLLSGLGARIEVPVTRAIVTAWRAATRDGAVWSVTLDPPPTAGEYQLVWRTSDPEPPQFEAMIPLSVSPAGAAACGQATREQITPLLADVAALLPARTSSDGVELGTFTTATTPTAAEVTRLIEMAVSDLLARVGSVAVKDAGEAKDLAALEAASLVEASRFPDELDSDRSAYRQYQAMYLNRVPLLAAAATAAGIRLA